MLAATPPIILALYNLRRELAAHIFPPFSEASLPIKVQFSTITPFVAFSKITSPPPLFAVLFMKVTFNK